LNCLDLSPARVKRGVCDFGGRIDDVDSRSNAYNSICCNIIYLQIKFNQLNFVE